MLLFPAAVFCADSAQVTEAKALFKSYKNLGDRFDSKLIDLYSDDAAIQNVRYYPNGQTKTMNLVGEQYKKLIAVSLPIAKARGGTDTYSKESYKQEGERVRITALRHSNLKNYDSWLVLLVEKRGDQWKIVQEQSQSRP